MANTEYTPFELDVNLEGDDVGVWDGEARPILPIGRYRFEVISAKPTDKGQIEFKCQVVEGEHKGALAWHNMNPGNDTGKKRMKHFMMVCGTRLDRFVSDDFIGQQFYGDIVHNEGKARPDSMGNVQEAKVFANIVRERSVADEEAEMQGLAAGETAPAPAEADPPKPPITRSTTSAPPAQPAAPAPSAPAGQANGSQRRTARRT